MGGCFSSSDAPKSKGVILLGMDSAGKTTLVYQFKLGKQMDTIPTLGHNKESVEIQSRPFQLYDVSGAEKMRDSWKKYVDQADAVVFVVDSADTLRAAETKKVFQKTFTEADKSKLGPVLVLCNKQDLQEAKSVDEIRQALGVDALALKTVNCMGCVARSGQGVKEAFDWIASNLPAV